MQTLKWYEETENQQDIYLSGRIRLLRNLEGELFPVRMDKDSESRVLEQMLSGLKDMETSENKPFEKIPLGILGADEREVLREKRIINDAAAKKQGPEELLLSLDERISITLGGEDHIRLQCISESKRLSKLWEEADRLDDYIGSRVSYAFHEKYGYLTVYPTNMGTGLRAGITLHLPLLSAGKQFSKYVNEMSRFGVNVKGVHGEGSENYGAIYEVSNQKTLGITEEEIINLVEQMAERLISSERKIRRLTMKEHRLDMEDEIFKSYGVLRYAKKLSVKEAMTYLSQVRLGQQEGILTFENPVNLYGLMMEIQPVNMKLISEQKEDNNTKSIRANYIRDRLPNLI